MLRLITILGLCIIHAFSYAQPDYDNKLYISGNIGFGINFNNKTEVANGYQLTPDNAFIEKASAFLNINNNFGLHLGLLGVGYDYHIDNRSIQSVNPNYYIWDNQTYFSNVKFTLSVGAGYKIQINRLTAIPFVDIGFIPIIQSSFSSFNLKEQNSNNIRKVSTNTIIGSGRFDYSFGADLYLHIGEHWGLSTNIQYDRFNPTTEFETISSDSYLYNTNHLDKIEFNHQNLILSFGLFVSFLKDNDK